MADVEVYHRGEIAVQERTGEREVARRRASLVGDHLVDGMRAFVAEQGVAAVSAAAPDDSLWASLWCGGEGFLRADGSGTQLTVVGALEITGGDDPVHPLAAGSAPLGMLVIDFVSRRRLRVNGVVSRADAAGLTLDVREVFGNCPKYIQRRTYVDTASSERTAPAVHGLTLDAERRAMIAHADTAFVASAHPVRGLDASHRGGEPGFLRVDEEGIVHVPDYRGNSMYQTLGNFDVDARAGLAVIDFERRRVLSLTGTVAVRHGEDDRRHPSGGTGRYWSLAVARWMEYALPPTRAWTLLDRSPLNPPAA